MAMPRFVMVERNGHDALINIEHIQSIEPDSDGSGAKITTMDGRTWFRSIDPDEDKYGDKISAAEKIIADKWYHTSEDEYEPFSSPYRDHVVATLIEGETIPVVVENSYEFGD